MVKPLLRAVFFAMEDNSKIFEAIASNDAALLKALLAERPHSANALDENKMTPLQHAAYKGSKEMVQLLLDQGADVQLCEHQHNYTALHFGALSGCSDVCLLLLEAGAKANETNTVGRSPAQMAAFVGHHNCVAVINNYVPKGDVPQLPPFLLESFHKFIMQINIHPIKVVMNVQSFVGLQEHLAEVKRVLEVMSEREMRRGQQSNEVMAFKLHYLGYIVGEVCKVREKRPLDMAEAFARKLLKPGKDDSLECMDAFLKESIREFPFRESTLFRQMVATLSGDEAPAALSVIGACINGQRGFLDSVAHCTSCGEEKPAKKCSKCKVVQYCDRNCQRLHWTWHKKSCSRLAQEGAAPDAKPARDVDLKELL